MLRLLASLALVSFVGCRPAPPSEKPRNDEGDDEGAADPEPGPADEGEADHFRAPTVLPVLGLASCVLLATQIEGAVWLRGLTIVGVGVLLAALTTLRRKKDGATHATPADVRTEQRTEADREGSAT